MANQRICSIPDCGKKVHGRSYCIAHYLRWRRHGDPTLGQHRAKAGEPEEYLNNTVMKYEGEDCLIWPYCKSGNGYAAIQQSRGLSGVSRIVCEYAHGAPSEPTLQAAHSCGNGHLGCVNPRHLRWATPVENAADKIGHRTLLIGRKNHKTTLSEEAVRQIRALEGEISTEELAKRYHVARNYVRQIQTYRTWRWLA